MGCRRSIPFVSSCALEVCENKARTKVIDPSTTGISDGAFSFAPDLCYAALLRRDGTNQYLDKYEPATNSFVNKVTIPAPFVLASSGLVYDASRQKFVWSVDSNVHIYDPITETVDSFDSGITKLWDYLYVPQKSRVYGLMGTDGTGLTYIGYLDLDLRIVVQLGVLPAVGAAKPRPNSLLYVPSTDSLYGCWQTGLGNAMARFNLATNVATSVFCAVEGVDICLDTDRNLILDIYGTANEVNPVTGVATTYILPALSTNTSFTPYYFSASQTVIGCGDDPISGLGVIATYDINAHTTSITKTDPPYDYWGLLQFKNQGFMALSYESSTSEDGVQKVCIP